MSKLVWFLFENKFFQKAGFWVLLIFVFLYRNQISDLEKENQVLKLELDHYKILCSDYEIKIKAQTDLVQKSLIQQKKIITQEAERQRILQDSKTERRTDNKEIVDYETHKKVIRRLNRPL